MLGLEHSEIVRRGGTAVPMTVGELGSEHPDTATLNNLGGLYKTKQSRCANGPRELIATRTPRHNNKSEQSGCVLRKPRAESLYQQTLAICKKILKPGHLG
ncbi:hypothetical protein BC938DRAFT_480374 [Jimgerdemannia flammicorona]|uniref:Uncharacterized protein n=1 Tax=Jimgerdemannia flammicorona TaxID=994334 RepID=A0A433QXA6_9FUNG|nr:hypothetical protein BC938DRAFT_480374 [Jimgerdemannia flammicorona]